MSEDMFPRLVYLLVLLVAISGWMLVEFRGSIGRADLEGGNFDQLRESIVARLLTLPDETMVYPGHGNPTTIGYEKMNNPFFR